MMSIINSPNNVVSHFAPPVLGLYALSQSEQSFATKILGGLLVADLGRRLYTLSRHNVVPGEGVSKKIVRALGLAASGALVLIGLYACVINNDTKSSSQVIEGPQLPRTEEERGFIEKPNSDEFWENHSPIYTKNQNGRCDGEKVLEQLQNSEWRPKTVSFEKPRLNNNLKGGVGMARSLDFLDRAMTQCRDSSDSDLWKRCLSDAIEPYRAGVAQTLLNRQIVWHTITSKIGDDPANRVQAMLNLHNFEIQEKFPKNDLVDNKLNGFSRVSDFFTSLRTEKDLPQSMRSFVIRGMRPSEDARAGEWWTGQTAIVLQRDNKIALFSSENGLFVGPLNSWASEMVVGVLKEDIAVAHFSTRTAPTDYRVYQVDYRKDL